MKAIMVMFDSLCRSMLPCYGNETPRLPNFQRLAKRTCVFDNNYAGSLPCMPARRELHIGRLNMLHRSWGPIEPFDDSMPELLSQKGVHTHIATDHFHYVQDGGATYMERYSTWECFRGQEDDKWKADLGTKPAEFSPNCFGIDQLQGPLRAKRAAGGWQNRTNRNHYKTDSDYPMSRTFSAGLMFLEENWTYDNWFLQIEGFDPHEPFDAPEAFMKHYFASDSSFESDWPPYTRATEPEAFREQVRDKYRASLEFCDYNLGRVLDFMDEHHLWSETMLIVNTDHGFLLGEHDWWGKGTMPDYQELVHTPLFIWDPEAGVADCHRRALVQTIDLAPTLLDYFGVKIPGDMLGKSLRQTIIDDTPIRDFAMMGFFGGQITITDGRYKLMYDIREKQEPVYEYTLMPTHMASRFSMNELRTAELAGPFSFSKGSKVLKIVPDRVLFVADIPCDLLYDLQDDPNERHPIDDPENHHRLVDGIRQLFQVNDAPRELYHRYGLKPA